MSSIRSLAFLLACVFIAACSPKSWNVVQQATPNPIHKTSSFYLDTLTFDSASAEANATQPTSDPAKSALAKAFAAGFEQERVDAGGEHFARANAATGADFTIRVDVVITLGSTSAALGSTPNTARADVKILQANGQLVDEFVTVSPLVSALPESTESQMQTAGQSLGASAGRYVKQRLDD